MKTYKSKKPTKEKKQLFRYMEKHKVGGTVSGKKLGRYIEKKGYRLEARGKTAFGVRNKKGVEIMRGGIHHKKPRVRMWFIT